MIPTEPSYHTMKNIPVNETLFNDEFIGYINSLSSAILQYVEVSKNINQNKDMLINFAKNELNKEEMILEYSINKNTSIIDLIQFCNDIFNKIEYSIQSDKSNLLNFFRDAKILFKKLKEKRKELIIESKRHSNSVQRKKPAQSTSLSLINNNIYRYNQNNKKISENNSKSEVNRNVKDLKYCVLYSKIDKKKLNLNGKERDKFNKNVINKGKSYNKIRQSINSEYFNGRKNDLISLSDNDNKSKSISPNKNLTEMDELQQLRMINKKLSSELNKYKTKTIDDKNNKSNNNNNNFNNFEKINIYIKDKDKVISTLKREMNQSTKKYKDILTQYKSRINKLQDENNTLRMNTAFSVKNSNNLSDYDKSLNSKLIDLIKENRKLKESIKEMKKIKVENDYNNQLKRNATSTSQTSINEINELKNKVIILQKYFSKKQEENKELNNQIILLKRKLEEEKNILSNKNLELSHNLINKQNELINLQKDNYNKNNEITNLKEMINLKLNNNSGNKNKVKNDEYEKIIYEFKSKIKELESNIEQNKKIKLDKDQQISILKKELNEKDGKIQEQNNNLEMIKNEFYSQEAEKKNLLNTIDILNKKISSQGIGQDINNLNEKLEEQKNINIDLNDELNKTKKDNVLLKNKILSSEKKISILKANSDLNETNKNTIEQLKNEIQSLKFENERINYQYYQLKENLGVDNQDKINKQNEEIEGLKQLVKKLQEEREKGDNELNIMKRENEKIKNQIIRLSETLPEEYSELQKQYHDLENKYKSLKKNNSKTTTPKKNPNIEILEEEKSSKDIINLKKEIEQLKKKNNELVSQLEDKEIKKNFYDIRSEDGNKSNFEEEFDLRKMAKGARDKNRSQDINIDYPGIQIYKEKIRELEFYYNSLESLVKKLLLTIQCTPKNKTYVTELCRMVGFNLEMTNKIINNKNKNFLSGLFSK